VTVTMRLTDNLSGVDWGQIDFESPSGNPWRPNPLPACIFPHRPSAASGVRCLGAGKQHRRRRHPPTPLNFPIPESTPGLPPTVRVVVMMPERVQMTTPACQVVRFDTAEPEPQKWKVYRPLI